MATVWVLVLWFGVGTDQGVASGLTTVGNFRNNTECLNALKVIRMVEGQGHMRGMCVEVIGK